MVELEGRRGPGRGLAMDPRLAMRFERLETARHELLGRLEGIDEEILNRPPRDAAWSVVQVLHHVLLAEELSIAYIGRKVDAEAERAGVIGTLRSWALRLALRSPLRFKAPPMTTELPERDSLPAVAARWEEGRGRMRQVLATIPTETVDRAIYRHPIVGRMSVDQAVRFFEDHLAHHEHQIERTLAAVERAAATG